MALMPCRECAAEISTSAATCPKCGAPHPHSETPPPLELETPGTKALGLAAWFGLGLIIALALLFMYALLRA